MSTPEPRLPSQVARHIRDLRRADLTPALVQAMRASPTAAAAVLREVCEAAPMSPAGALFPGSIPFEEDTARTRAAGAAALLAALFDDHEALERLPYEDLALIATSINDDHLALLARLGPSLAPRLSAGLRRHTQQDTTRTRPPYGLLDTAVLVHAAATAPATEATLSHYRARRIIVQMVIVPETDERDVAIRKCYRQWAKQDLEALRAPLSQPALPGDGTGGAPGAGAATASPDGADHPDDRAEVVRVLWVAMEQSGLLTGRRPRTLTPDLILADPSLRNAADEPLGFARDVLHAEGLCDWIPAEGEIVPPYDQFLLLGQKLSAGAAGIEDVELVDEGGHLVPRADHHQRTDMFRLHWTEHGTPRSSDQYAELSPWMDLTRLDQLLADWTDPEGRRMQVELLAEDSAGVVLAAPGAWERYLELVG